MTTHTTHPSHNHVHGNCEHPAVQHSGHVDYLHDGHLHSIHGDHIDEHRIEVDTNHPADCTPQHRCSSHEQGHVHSATCGHARVPHGDHTDFLVEGHLHHTHGDHCDSHGALIRA